MAQQNLPDLQDTQKRKYRIFAGLAGGFGGAEDRGTIECYGQDVAEQHAYEEACQTYDGYAGLRGLRDVGQIMEEDGVDEEEAQQIFEDERESWLDYHVELVTE